MTSRKMLTATLAALALVATASVTDAAARYHRHHGHHRHGMSNAASTGTGRSSQDNMADRLNAQSLQQSRGAPQGAVSPMDSAPPGALPR